MKFHKFIFTVLTLLFTFQFCLAQDKSETVLAAEFDDLIYDHYRSMIIMFLHEVISVPNSTGYIVIYGNKTNPLKKYSHEIAIKEQIAYYKFPNNRVVFLHGEDRENLKTQLWVVPKGAEKPNFIEADWNYKLPQNIKPFIVHKKSWIVEDGFETFSIEFYSKFLVADSKLQGNLVIYAKSTTRFHQIRKRLLNELVNKNRVLQSQLKFFYLKSNKSDVEFWFVPKSAQ